MCQLRVGLIRVNFLFGAARGTIEMGNLLKTSTSLRLGVSEAAEVSLICTISVCGSVRSWFEMKIEVK